MTRVLGISAIALFIYMLTHDNDRLVAFFKGAFSFIGWAGGLLISLAVTLGIQGTLIALLVIWALWELFKNVTWESEISLLDIWNTLFYAAAWILEIVSLIVLWIPEYLEKRVNERVHGPRR